jgi:hypothetical protein
MASDPDLAMGKVEVQQKIHSLGTKKAFDLMSDNFAPNVDHLGRSPLANAILRNV